MSIDISEIKNMMGENNFEGIANILQLISDDLTKSISNMMAKEPSPDRREVAHSLKGIGLQLGLDELIDIAAYVDRPEYSNKIITKMISDFKQQIDLLVVEYQQKIDNSN